MASLLWLLESRCYEQQVVTLRVCASRWTEVCGFIGSWGKKQTKMAGVLKIIIIFVIFSLSVECRKDKVFCAICGKGLTASKSQRRAQFRAVSGYISDGFLFWFANGHVKDRRVLCISCRTAPLPWIIKCKRARLTPPQPPVSRPDSEPWICYKYSSNTPSKNWSPP